jgi:PAS domain S-box-containing protein
MRQRHSAFLLFAGLFAITPPKTFALDPNERPENYILRRWDMEDGLPTSPNRHILQSRDGYLWFGTGGGGLIRFDGIAFTAFPPAQHPDAPDDVITALLEDRDGTLWAGTQAALHSHRHGHFHRFTEKDGLHGNGASALCLGPDGALWIGNNLGITRYVGGRFVKDIDTHTLNTIGIRHMWADPNGNVWVASGVQLLRCKGTVVTAFGVPEGLPPLGIESVNGDGHGHVLVSTQSGLFQFDEGRFIQLPYAFANPRISTTHVDHDGNLWVGSGSGLERISNGRLASHTLPNGKTIGAVDAIFEDREGTLWLLGSGTIFRLNNRRAVTWAEEKGIRGTVTLGVCRSRDGSIWISSWGGGVVRLRNDETRQYRAGAPLSNDNVTCIYEAPDGSMWFGNRGSAVDHLEGDRVTTYVYAPGVPTSRPVTAIYLDDNGDLLMGIASRGLFRLRNGTIEAVPEAPDLTRQSIWGLLRTRDGRLLLATSAGLFQREVDQSWRSLPLPADRKVSVNGITEDKTGELWLATAGCGIVRFRGSDCRSYRREEGLPTSTFSTIITDEAGSIWAAYAGGIARIERAEFDAFDRHEISQLNPVSFGRDDGVTSASVLAGGTPTAERAPDGSLLFATLKGVAVITPQAVQINSRPPDVRIESVLLDGQPITIGEERAVTIPSGVNRLEIRYTALSLIVPERQRFRYQLVGSDPTWINAGRSRIASYTHLAPGSYRFNLLACNNDGVWTKEAATLMLVVTPKFHQTLWFKLLALSLLAGGVAAAVAMRTRQLKQRQVALLRTNAELDQRVRERTAELEQREILFRLIFEHAPVGVSWSRSDLGATHHFNSAFRRLLDLPGDELPDDQAVLERTHPDDAPRQIESEARLREGKADTYVIEQRFLRPDGREVFGLLAAAIVRDRENRPIQHIRILEDVTELKKAQNELVKTHQRLLDASRLAGMAEVATGVLHNVGNVLNSVNVSATLLNDGLRGLRLDNVAKVSVLVREHANDLAHFFQEDPKGRQVAPFLETLADHLTQQRQRLLAETENLRKNVHHIREIVERQQSTACFRGLTEPVAPAEMVEDALRLTSVALDRHGVDVIREFAPVPSLVTERHKALQILTNLVQNAKQALDAKPPGARQLRIGVAQHANNVRIEVEDNGVGIPPENLIRIFEMGFTTRKDGHGFGLHSSAIAARELGGQLTVQSRGVGQGACFVLELPVSVTDA